MAPSTVTGALLVSDPWLSKMLGRKAFRLSRTLEASCLGPLEEQLKEHRRTPSFISAQIPAHHIALAHSLEDMGFRLIDTRITFTAHTLARTVENPRVVIRLANPADEAGVAELAETCFTYSRFHLDPLIPGSIARAIKREWARNYFLAQRGEQMAVAEAHGKIVGFAQILAGADKSMIIDLLGVAPHAQRQGIASALLAYADAKGPAHDHLRVGTQATNIASMRCYEKCGFSVSSTDYVFHLHGAPSLL